MNEGLFQNSISSAQIYDGGNYSKITAEDLKGNIVAIRQLINNFNEKSKKLDLLEKELQQAKTELEFQNTYQYMAIVTAILNVIGTIVIGVGINLITDDKTSGLILGYAVVVAGGLVILAANIAAICYRWVKKWFNK